MRTTPSAENRLAAFTHELSRASDLAEPRVVRGELATVFEHGVPDTVGTVPAADPPIVPRRNRMLTTLSGVLATITGKVVLGTAVAAASVGAAHSSGAVDVPGLPDTAPPVESPDTDHPDIDVQGPDEASDRGSDGQPGTTGAPDDPGVDGSDVADRATSGEPQEDGREFGSSIADEATDGTPAEDKAGGPDGEVGGSGDDRPDTTPGNDTSEENTPDETPGGSDTADEHTPDATGPPSAPADRP